MIRITSSGNGSAFGTKVFTEDGDEIKDITGLTIKIRPNAFVIAEVECITGGIDLTAHPLLGFETVCAAAIAHGYEVMEAGAAAELKAYRDRSESEG